MAKSGQRSLDELRACLLQLAAKQSELRGHLEEYRARTGEAVGTVARQTGITWAALNRFVEGSSVLSGGQGLASLCKLLGCTELGTEIAALAKKAGDRNLGLASCPSAVIEAALDLIEYHRAADGYSTAEFAEAFGDDASMVQGVLNGSQDALGALNDEATLARVTEVLYGDIDSRLVASRERMVGERRRAGERLAQIVAPLLKRVGGKESLAGMLGCHRTTLNNALAGQASLDQIEKLIKGAERLAAIVAPQSPANTPVGAVPGNVAAAGEAALGLSAELEALGGETVAGGIKHVLTAASFQQIETVALVDLLEMLIKNSSLMRLLLNFGSQLGDNTAREILREDSRLKAELRELVNAIRLFTFEDPSQLLDVYDDDRAHTQGQTGEKRKDTKRRR